jgi:hypothetical protein
MCGFNFLVGRVYLVYASRTGGGDRLRVSSCSSTRLSAEAEPDLAYLRSITEPRPALGTIQGTVGRPSETPAPYPGAPYANVPVTVTSADGPARRYHAISNSAGEFSVQVPRGEYRVTLDARGVPVPFLSVDALDQANSRRTYASAEGRAVTNEGGVFEISRLRPATYVIGLYLGRGAERPTAWRFFSPAGSVDSATSVPVGFGERVVAPELILPEDVVPVLIQGSVTDADGRAAKGATVYLYPEITTTQFLAGPIPVDDGGHFRLTVIAGQTYHLSVEQRVGAGYRNVNSEPFLAARDLPPFNLRFPR